MFMDKSASYIEIVMSMRGPIYKAMRFIAYQILWRRISDDPVVLDNEL